MGRPSVLTPQQQAEGRQRREEGATLKELARSSNISMATISRLRYEVPIRNSMRTTTMNFTLADYEKALADLAEQEAKWDAYTGNNPEKWHAARKTCRERVRLIELSLKRAGILTQTAHEQVEQALDREFSNAKSNQIVEFEGKRYQLKFIPAARSRSGKSVTSWKRWWQLVTVIAASVYMPSLSGSAGAVTTIGSNLLCWSWSDIRRAPLSQQPMTYIELEASVFAESWAFGFLSGLAVASGRDVLNNVDANQVWPWIDNACRVEPNATVGDVLLRWWNARFQ